MTEPMTADTQDARSTSPEGVSRSLVWVCGAVIAIWIALSIQVGQSLSWDEVEFFRATRWVAEGRVPYRDYWEHHTPLQWLAFAPIAGLVANGPGAESVIAMRWAQLPLWVALFFLWFRTMRRAGLGPGRSWIALFLPLASLLFVGPAIEYRVDTLGNLGYVAALAVCLTHPRKRGAWMLFGLLMSVAVLANVRMAPLVIATAALLAFLRIEERRWRWNPISLWMSAGVALSALGFLIWLRATGAWEPFLSAMRLNVVIDRILSAETTTLLPTLLLPVTTPDPAALLLWIGAAAGVIVALRDIRCPAIPQLFALLAILSVVSVIRLGVHYSYHMQTSFLLMAPVAASVVTSARLQRLALLLIAGLVCVELARSAGPSYGQPMKYVDGVMEEVDRRTAADERVWDGCGYALRREPVFRYWFLPSVVRIAAARGMIERYDAPQMIAAPPAAIIHGYRVHLWLKSFPALASYATHHYVPLFRDLWVPGLSATIDPRRPQAGWIVPRSGRYRFYASALLPKHPWFRDPLQYAIYAEEDADLFEVAPARLPAADLTRARLFADGRELAVKDVLDLSQGSAIRLESSWSEPVGVLIVPVDATTLFIPPAAKFAM